MATIRAYVYKVSAGIFDAYKVYPPVVVLSANDTFELVNTVEDHDCLWTVPGEPFDHGLIKNERIPPKGRSTKAPKNNLLVSVEYQVQVDGKRATAHSDPVIIIDQ